ncbi:hypothetical protein TNCV_4908911 [Trichonephila clavipes]|uniref:Uncharacterized protein n=1 Tax=Trichonephila clavipes TaxID=2585209 RepID=A0A8X6V3T9_TRICX|nr:hypothetical protein TNCV_4908911 [Trichonephila clavipes]
MGVAQLKAPWKKKRSPGPRPGLLITLEVEKAQNSPQLSNSLTLSNADSTARHKLTSYPVKRYFIPDLNCNQVISTTIAKLRTRHFKGMKTSPDDPRSYNTCLHRPDIQLSPNHIFNCPFILVKLHNIDQNTMNYQLLYSPKSVDIARAILDAFGVIRFLSSTWTRQQQKGGWTKMV